MNLRFRVVVFILALLSLSVACLVSCNSSRKTRDLSKGKYDNTKIVYFVEYFNADTVNIMADRKRLTALVTTNALTGEGRSFKLNGKRIIIRINNDTTFYIDGFDTSFNNLVVNKFEKVYSFTKSKDTILTSW